MPKPQSTTPRIKVGVMGNGLRFPAWQAEAIRRVRDLPGVEISLLLVPDRPARRSAPALARFKDGKRILWTLFNKGYIERRSRASRGVDMSQDLGEVPLMRCRTEPVGRYGERFSEDDVASVRDRELDLVLRFGFGILKGEILDTPRFGVWSFHHGDEREYRGRPPGFWELFEGKPLVGSILQRLTERLDGGVVLHRGFFKATPYSYRRTRDDIYLGSAVWPSIVVRQLANGNQEFLEAAPSTTDASLRTDPTNVEMMRFLTRQAGHWLRAQFRGLAKAAIWTIGVVDAPIAGFLSDQAPEVAWLPERGHGTYLADPFGVMVNGQPVILAEDYDHARHRGVISSLRPGSAAQPALDPGVHASYPYLFADGDELFCVPETYQSNQVRLYRAVDFPAKWELVAVILEGFPALDATLFPYSGRWWMFCTNRDDGPNEKLLVYHSVAIAGPWKAHALNPVKTDIRSARPAGTPFVHEGSMYRPAQDGSISYGGSVTITRIDELTPDRFHETAVVSVPPPKTGRYRAGIHTISAVGDKTLVDGRRDTFVPAAFRRELRARLARLKPGATEAARSEVGQDPGSGGPET